MRITLTNLLKMVDENEHVNFIFTKNGKTTDPNASGFYSPKKIFILAHTKDGYVTRFPLFKLHRHLDDDNYVRFEIGTDAVKRLIIIELSRDRNKDIEVSHKDVDFYVNESLDNEASGQFTEGPCSILISMKGPTTDEECEWVVKTVTGLHPDEYILTEMRRHAGTRPMTFWTVRPYVWSSIEPFRHNLNALKLKGVTDVYTIYTFDNIIGSELFKTTRSALKIQEKVHESSVVCHILRALVEVAGGDFTEKKKLLTKTIKSEKVNV